MTTDPGPFSLPNLLTIARIVMIPVIVVLMLLGGAWRWGALVLYVAAAVTDYLDGYLARRQEGVSPFGRMLDPIADKLLVAAIIVACAFDGTLSALDLIPAIAILMREILVSGLREFLAGAVTVPVTMIAKYKTTTQLVALGVLVAEPMVPAIWPLSDLLLWLAAILTVISGYDYFRRSWPHLTGNAS